MSNNVNQQVGEDKGENSNVLNVLNKLTRLVVKCFYQPQHLLLIDMIIREKHVTQETVENVLKFDVKMIRITLGNLKHDRIIYMKSKKIVTPGQKSSRVNYFLINYARLVNIFKYKLDNLRKRLETLEKEANAKDSYRCIPCNKIWTDLQAGELFNAFSLNFKCFLCGQVVNAEQLSFPKDIRQIVARFNQQADLIYDLIKQAEDLYKI